MLFRSASLALVAAVAAVGASPALTPRHSPGASADATNAPDVKDFKAFHIGAETSCTKQIIFQRKFSPDIWSYEVFGFPPGVNSTSKSATYLALGVDESDEIAVVSIRAGGNRGQYRLGDYTLTPVQVFDGCGISSFGVRAYVGKDYTPKDLVYTSPPIPIRGLVPNSVGIEGRPTRARGTRDISISWSNSDNIDSFFILAGLKNSTEPVASKNVKGGGADPVVSLITAPTDQQVAVGISAYSQEGAVTSINAVSEYAA